MPETRLPYTSLEIEASNLAARLRWRWREVLRKGADLVLEQRDIIKALGNEPPLSDAESSALDALLRQLDEQMQGDFQESLGLAVAYGVGIAQAPQASGYPALSKEKMQALKKTPQFADRRAMQFAQSYAFSSTRSKDAKVMERFRYELIDALHQGRHPSEAARKVSMHLKDDLSAWERITRTEMARALSMGLYEECDNLGVSFVWFPKQPNNCPACTRLLTERVFPLDAVRAASNYGKKPTDWVAASPMHPNCTCTPVPASASLVEAAKQANGGTIPAQGVVVSEVPTPANRKETPR